MILADHDMFFLDSYTQRERVKKLVTDGKDDRTHDMPKFYQIKVKGHLGPVLAAWFDDLTVTNTPRSEAVLSGYLQDQAALYGVLLKIHQLGMTLLSVNPIESASEDELHG
jgi:hypothetical protein